MSVEDVLQTYAGRWAVEVTFRDLKQLLGFGDSQARKRTSVERTAPFVGFMLSTLVLWFAHDVHRSSAARPPVRPWYPHKRGLCFADVMRTAQRVLVGVDVLDLANDVDNMRKHPSEHAALPLRQSHSCSNGET